MSPVATGSSTQPGPTSQPHSASPLATLENEARDSTQRQQSPAQNASTPEQLSLDIAFYDLQARQPDSHEPIFVAERSEVHHLDAPFPCAIDGCMTYIAPKNQDIKDHLAYAHSIRDPVRCPWPDHLCKDKHDLKDARTVCRHIRERHGWKFTWRCPWCRKDYPPGMRRDSARRLNKDCFDKEQAKRQVQLVIAEVTKLIEERPELAEDLLASCPSVFEGLNAPQE
ncbi:uncharacterized protein C8Q71DRAFT_857202 [Rhodofomes roseus]|uniref:C2H2-type domain-containing protein n=1 Tax=Rhodofomes roseus TaxID=34475 RepID=A0ABQ8KJ54_9APHY|nr:uncharacterized protein C8Q71DRAFT_857202 [Rhodofomes roseus]KAH9838034.1 hypothetical protein C8Q71DRAFT_857202 [Rhodofomes roseus]